MAETDPNLTGCQNLTFKLYVEFAMHISQLAIFSSLLAYVYFYYKPFLGANVRKTICTYFFLQLTRSVSAGLFAILDAAAPDMGGMFIMGDQVVQIAVFMGTFIIFYHFLLRLKTV